MSRTGPIGRPGERLPRRLLALILELAVGILLVTTMAFLVHRERTTSDPSAFQLHVYALCQDVVGFQAAPLRLVIEQTGIRGRVYYGRPVDPSKACSAYTIVSSVRIEKPVFKVSKGTAGEPLSVETVKGVHPHGEVYFVNAKLKSSLDAIEFFLPGSVLNVRSGRVGLAIDGGEFPLMKSYRKLFGGEPILPKYKVRPVTYMRLYPDVGFTMESASPSPVLLKVNWSRAHNQGGDSGTSDAPPTPRLRYDFKFSPWGSAVRVSMINRDSMNQAIALLSLYSILLGIGVGFLVDSVKYLVRGR